MSGSFRLNTQYQPYANEDLNKTSIARQRQRVSRNFEVRVRVAEVKRIAIDRGTLLLQLPEAVDLAAVPVANRAAESSSTVN